MIIQKTETYKISEKSDNYQNFSYENRYLDALSAFFAFTTKACASTKQYGTIYISYNRTLSTNKNIKHESNIFKTLKQVLIEKQEYMFHLYILLNIDLKGPISYITKNYLNTDFGQKALEFKELRLKLKEEFQNNHKTRKFSKSQEYNFESNKEPLEELKNIFLELTKLMLNYEIVHNFKEQIFRPIQDVEKLKHYMRDNPINYASIHLQDNKDNLHAEHNLSTKFNHSTYIGVSKLSCGYCDYSLNDNNHSHRGTHGVCDEKWKPNAKRQKIDQGNSFSTTTSPVLQHRELSYDSFEKNISISDILSNFIDNQNEPQRSLHDFKDLYGLIGQNSDAIPMDISDSE